MSSCMYSSILIIMYSSLTEIVSASVAGQISSDSSNVVELIEVRSDGEEWCQCQDYRVS